MKFKSPPIHRTPLYRATAAYNGMLARCENRNGKNPAYAGVYLSVTLEAWLAWSIPRYEEFLRSRPDESPCAARKGDSGDYVLGNIEIISVKENRARQATKLVLRPDGTKMCGTCREVKPASAFSMKKSRPDRLNPQCRSCNAISVNRWRQKKRTSSTTVAALAS